jgi:hypothetical protein
MQKLTILIFTILINFLTGIACDCDGEYSFRSEFYHCDVILSGTIKKVFERKQDSYKIEIEIDNLFKGDSIKEFAVYSTPENFEVIENGDTLIYVTSCDIYLHVGEDWLIYADQRKDGDFGFGFCSLTKMLNVVDESEIDFLNHSKELKMTDDCKFYSSQELDNSELISVSERSYPMILNYFTVEGIKTESLELKLKIDKKGFVVFDDSNNDNLNCAIKEIKNYEPFLPGTRAGAIVNSEHMIIVKKK